MNDPIFGRRYVDVQVQIDEELLKKISESTGGQYFRAVDKDSLERIFKTIDGLEKSRISVKSYTHYNEVFGLFSLAGFGFDSGGVASVPYAVSKTAVIVNCET